MSHPTVERPDEALVRARLDALATAMDLVPERTGGTLHLDRRPAARARRGPAVRMAGAAAAVLIVAAIVAIGASRHDDGVALSTAGATLTDPPPPVAAANPATGDQVSELPVVPATPSDGFDLSDTGSWPGRGDLAAPRSTPEVAVRSYLAAALGETTAAGSTLHRWPVVTVDGAVTVSAALPSGQVVSVMSFHEAGGWTAENMGIGGTKSTPSALPGDTPNTATEFGVPVVDGATGGRLWYRARGQTWQMEFGPDTMSVVTPALVGLEGDQPTIRLLVPDSTDQIEGIVFVYLDADGNPITFHAASGLACCAPDGGS